MFLGFSGNRFIRVLRDADDAGGSAVIPQQPAHVSNDEWEGLSPSEREALTETDEGEGAHQILGTDEEAALDDDADFSDEELAAIAGEAAEEKDPADITKEETDVLAALAAVDGTPAVEAATTAATAGVTLPSDEDLLSFRPVVSNADLPFSSEIPDEIQVKFDELEDKFEAGDLSAKELRTEQNKLNIEVLQHQTVARDNAREDLVWKREQAAFLSARPAEYKQFEQDGKTLTGRSEMLFGALSSQVSRILKDPASANKSGMQILVAADKAVRAAFSLPAPGKAVTQPPPAAAPAKPAVKPPAAQRTAPTLKDTPIAEGEQIGNPYSAILRLSGEKYERAIERMTPAQREQFEAFVSR